MVDIMLFLYPYETLQNVSYFTHHVLAYLCKYMLHEKMWIWDDNIHRIQADGVATQAKQHLSWQTATLRQDKDDSDLFADCKEDNDELESNVTVTDNNTDQLTTAYLMYKIALLHVFRSGWRCRIHTYIEILSALQ